jgi:hypothetical protein
MVIAEAGRSGALLSYLDNAVDYRVHAREELVLDPGVTLRQWDATVENDIDIDAGGSAANCVVMSARFQNDAFDDWNRCGELHHQHPMFPGHRRIRPRDGTTRSAAAGVEGDAPRSQLGCSGSPYGSGTQFPG